MTNRIWVLGAPDPEMEAIESLLRSRGEAVEYATEECGGGPRVHAGNAYRCPITPAGIATAEHGGTVYLVECVSESRLHTSDVESRCVRIDHHRPGDPGYGRPPSEFLASSSLGQVISELAKLGLLPWPSHRRQDYACAEGDFRRGNPGGAWEIVTTGHDGPEARDYYLAIVPRDLVVTAAADHCLGAAYRGECPGVDPDELMRFRAESRARFQKRSVQEVLADIERAQDMIRCAPFALIGEDLAHGTPDESYVRDLRILEPMPDGRGASVSEVPEAALRMGVGYIAGPLRTPDGRMKIVCSGTEYQVRSFLAHFAVREGLVDTYGDPMHGFAGGYLSA